MARMFSIKSNTYHNNNYKNHDSHNGLPDDRQVVRLTLIKEWWSVSSSFSST